MIKRRDFYHKSIKYSFNWNIKHHKEIMNNNISKREEFRKLGSFFKNVYNGNIPNNLFNMNNLPRISQFKIRGLKKDFLLSFSKKLIRNGKIIKYDSNSKLPNSTIKVFESYKGSNMNKKPGHDPVLKNILIKDKHSVAIEVPIWKKTKESYITGHIDLIQIEGDIIKVIDYKPEGKFLMSLPQVATYGLLLKSIFGINELKCLSFNKNEAWEYDPIILLKDIRDYLISQKISRIWEAYLA